MLALSGEASEPDPQRTTGKNTRASNTSRPRARPTQRVMPAPYAGRDPRRGSIALSPDQLGDHGEVVRVRHLDRPGVCRDVLLAGQHVVDRDQRSQPLLDV